MKKATTSEESRKGGEQEKNKNGFCGFPAFLVSCLPQKLLSFGGAA
jgi:hypothetical protein